MREVLLGGQISDVTAILCSSMTLAAGLSGVICAEKVCIIRRVGGFTGAMTWGRPPAVIVLCSTKAEKRQASAWRLTRGSAAVATPIGKTASTIHRPASS